MLNTPDIPLIPVNLILVRNCREQWQNLSYCVMKDIQPWSSQKQNSIKLSKQSALTVSQQLSINQQDVIGMTGSALA